MKNSFALNRGFYSEKSYRPLIFYGPQTNILPSKFWTVLPPKHFFLENGLRCLKLYVNPV